MSGFSLSLSSLLRAYAVVPVEQDCPVYGLSLDSRQITPGTVFFALQGLNHHGLEFAKNATDLGCVAIVWEADPNAPIVRLQDCDVPAFEVKQLSLRLGLIAKRFYQEPSNDLDIVGITGTNGKTSTAQLIAGAMEANNIPAGTIGTLGWGRFGEVTPQQHTTPDAIAVQKALAQLKLSKARWVAMEVSSHALDQGRINGVHFKAAVFTNLSRDHLDYHENMAAYAEVKASLMTVPGLELVILNADDDYFAQMRAVVGPDVNVISFGIAAGNVNAREIELTRLGIQCEVDTPWGSFTLKSSLMGRFNLMNLLAVVSLLGGLGWSLTTVRESIAQLQPVAGRMNLFQAPGQPLVVVDYAHTPDALSEALAAIREHGLDHIVCVFGCGGDRDKGKRKQMAQVAEKLAQDLVLTDDNPRTEDGDQIIADMLEGIKRQDSVRIIRDRSQAIREAIQTADSGSAVLIAGKGHENYQEVNGQRYHLDDREQVCQALEICS